MAQMATDTRTVTLKQAEKICSKAFRIKRPMMIWGAPGIGKSDLVRLLGKKLKRDVVDIRLPLWEPTDIKGMPFYNAKIGKMEWAPPAELPTDPKSKAIVFLDEINGAAPSVQAAAYQLILDRKIGTYKLPENVLLIAAGNRETDKGVTYRMPKPLANRFIHMEIKVDFTCWMEWAVDNQIHPDVVGYLQFQKKDLYDFSPTADTKAFPTPRSWSFVSELMYDSDTEKADDTDRSLEMDMVSGCVGEGVATKFQTHRNQKAHLPLPEDILAGKVKTAENVEISGQYALTTGMCYELKESCTVAEKEKKMNEWHDKAGNFIQFMMDNFNTEMTIFGARMALKTYGLPFDHRKLANFKDFFERFGKLIIEA
jgi:hypothetical protein